MRAQRTMRARWSGPCALSCGRGITEGQSIGKLAPGRWAHVACINARLDATARNRPGERASRGAVRRSTVPAGVRVGERVEPAEAAVTVLF
jgi:hypothetical protein